MQNQSFLEETFKQDYNSENWKDILSKIFPHVSFFKAPELMELPESKEEDAKNIYRYGTITLGDGKTIDLYEVELQDGKSVTRNRVGLRNLLHNYVISGLVDGVIATYYNKNTNDWRLSFISKKAYWDDEQGLLKEETHPKRYTFVLGKNESIKTALQRIQLLIKLVTQGHVIGIEDLLRAFSVQKISKEFFDEYKRNYQAFTEFLGTRTYRDLFTPEGKDLTEDEQKKETERNISNFAKKLLGRIVFLYFLQKKGWLGVPKDEPWGNGERDFVSKLFNDCEDKNSFYEQSLVPLFFETLNKKRADNLFKLTGTKVPFLNGGLFDKITNETTEIKFEPQLFEDLFLFFNNYNFTIDENSPDDLDIGIDPEMLGLIFENLLEENRKRTGAFYTPKEVVHYMCKESLSLYLQKQLSDKLNAEEIKVLDSFIKQTNADTPGLIKTHADDIQRNLDRVKICDPAIGSGAFPLGILFEILRIRKEIFPHLSKQKNFSYRNEKLNIMRNNIYGVDIDSGAVDIARLRFWLSLIVDEEEPSPLPNLDYKIMQGDSMMECFENIDLSKVKTKAKNIKVFEPERDLFGNIKNAQLTINSAPFDTEALEEKVRDFFKIEDSDEKRQKHNEIDNDVLKHIEERCAEYRMLLLEKEQAAQKVYDLAKSVLKTDMQLERFATGKEAKSLALWQKKLIDLDRIDERLHQIVNQTERPYFLWHLFFKDVFDNGGFDIVIGNPPYGVSFSEELKNQYELASKDSYGIFMAHAIKHLLKPNGTCTFIVSDTWLTIKSHLPLRELVLQNQLHKIIRLPADTFGATVNTCIYIQSKTLATNQSQLIAADLTNLSPQKRLPEFRDTLFNLEKYAGIYTPDFAVYRYPQQIINTNSNLPIFAASPKLFALMNDTTCPTRKEDEETGLGSDIRMIQLNDKQVDLVRFGDIADIKVGLQTGDNDYYLFQNPEARGNYKDINQFKDFLLTENDLDKIRSNESLRKKITEQGIHQKKQEKDFDKKCWFDGRYIVPYDKGGESDTDSGWLPNYYVSTNYFIDWSRGSVKRLKELTTKNRNKLYGKPGGDNKICSRFQNKEFYFLQSLDYSPTGIYSPSVRKSSDAIFCHKASSIFLNSEDHLYTSLGLLTSKLIKYVFKVFGQHTIESPEGKMLEIPINLNLINSNKLKTITTNIIAKQKTDSRYDYQSNEQKQIDLLVYEAYGLNKADINEVETWYARRYTKMAKYADMINQDELIEKIAEEIAAENLYAKRVRELLELGENKRTEYKSTLRYCLKQKSPQLYIEHSVLKTIAAFLNSDGGTLLIGVDDDGNILGLDNDYSTFGKDKNYQDEWVKHFDNLTGHAFGNAVMNNINLNFALIDDKAIAIIDVNTSATHIFMKNKSDGNRKQFYIRRNGSTVELDAEETVAYVKQKWG